MDNLDVRLLSVENEALFTCNFTYILRARGIHAGGVSLARARSFFAPIYFLAPAAQATMTSTKIRLLYFKAQQRLKQICIVKQQP